MRTATVVIADELLDGPAKVALVERDQIIEAFTPDGPDQALAVCVRHWCSDGSPDGTHAEPIQKIIKRGGKDRVAVMDYEPVWMVEGQKLAGLLRGPSGCRMLGDIDVQNRSGANLHRHEHIQGCGTRR